MGNYFYLYGRSQNKANRPANGLCAYVELKTTKKCWKDTACPFKSFNPNATIHDLPQHDGHLTGSPGRKI